MPEPMIEMAWTMVKLFIPGAFLGFSMMPLWWLAAPAIVVVGLLAVRSRWRADKRGVKRWLLVACVSGVFTIVLFARAVWAAHSSCHRPPADGFCMFDGFPFLSLSALALLVGILAAVESVRLRNR